MVNFIQLIAVFVVPVALSSPGFQTGGIIGIVLPGGKLADGVNTAPEGDLGRGNELGVALLQGIFLLDVLHQLRGKGFGCHLRIDEGDLAVLFLQLRTERTFQDGLGPGLVERLEFGRLLIVKADFPFVEGIPGVHVAANPGQGQHGLIVIIKGIGFPVCGIGFLKSLGGLESGGDILHLLFPGSQVGSAVGDLGKGHV